MKDSYSVTHPVMVGRRIQRFREAYGWAATEFAHRTRTSPQSVGNYEGGTRRPEPGVLLKFRLTVGMTADYVLLGDETTLSDDARAKLAAAQAGGNKPVKARAGRKRKPREARPKITGRS